MFSEGLGNGRQSAKPTVYQHKRVRTPSHSPIIPTPITPPHLLVYRFTEMAPEMEPENIYEIQDVGFPVAAILFTYIANHMRS